MCDVSAFTSQLRFAIQCATVIGIFISWTIISFQARFFFHSFARSVSLLLLCYIICTNCVRCNVRSLLLEITHANMRTDKTKGKHVMQLLQIKNPFSADAARARPSHFVYFNTRIMIPPSKIDMFAIIIFLNGFKRRHRRRRHFYSKHSAFWEFQSVTQKLKIPIEKLLTYSCCFDNFIFIQKRI